MPSSASCRDHPRIREDASEPHRAFGAYPAGLGVAHVFESSVREALKARRLPGVLDDWCPGCPRMSETLLRKRPPEPDLRHFSNATASRASLKAN